MSHVDKALSGNDLSGTLCRMSDTLNDRAAQRLKEEKHKKKFSERDVGQMLSWSQSKVAQKLSGRTPITLVELEQLCFILTIAPTEVVRDRGVEFCAEMTPLELRYLERLRQLPADLRDSLMRLVDMHANTRMESRGLTKTSRGRINKIR